MSWTAKSGSLKEFEAGDPAFEEQHKEPEVHRQWAFARQLAGQIIGSNQLGKGKDYSVELSGNATPDLVEKIPETRSVDAYDRRTPQYNAGDSISIVVTQKGDIA
jgi:hypothetical protein